MLPKTLLQSLKTRAHTLKPVLLIGQQGVSPSVLAELDVALTAHELIKVRVNAEDRDSRKAMIEALCSNSGAFLVQNIGHIAVLYRAKPEKKSTKTTKSKKTEKPKK
jgi:RNA-binding protein